MPPRASSPDTDEPAQDELDAEDTAARPVRRRRRQAALEDTKSSDDSDGDDNSSGQSRRVRPEGWVGVRAHHPSALSRNETRFVCQTSCHQCKASRSAGLQRSRLRAARQLCLADLLVPCTKDARSLSHGKSVGRMCRKKYCYHCLDKFYQEAPDGIKRWRDCLLLSHRDRSAGKRASGHVLHVA
jgi:hypothetical protein